MRLRQEQAYAAICEMADATGHVPSATRLGERMGISSVGAWKHMKGLIQDGRLRRSGDRIVISHRVDLRPVPTDQLVSELARRRAVSHAGSSR